MYFEYDIMGITNSGIFRGAIGPWPSLAKKKSVFAIRKKF